MKIQLLLLAFFIGSCFVNAQATYVPDDNFENYLETHDANGNVVSVGSSTSMGNGIANDDFVTTANINSITTLNIPARNIVDLTGLEAFAALETLRCYNNNLNGLDVSQNLYLTHLYCDNTNLTSLDVSQNTSLLQLYCSNNNILSIDLTQNLTLEVLYCYNGNLTSLDVSNNINLEYIRCEGNLLENIDVSLNTNLVYLKCDNNNLMTLNVANGNNSNFAYFNASLNPNLFCVEVDNIAYSTTNWLNVDPVSSFSISCSGGLTYVPDDNFEQQLINLGHDSGPLDDYVPTANIDNLLSIDLEDQGIVNLTGIEDFTALQTLYCHTNLISTLDLSSNVNLITLVCNDNLLTNLNLAQNVNLTHINCSGNQLSSLAIGNATILTELYIIDNEFTNFDGTGLSSLVDFRCQNNQLTTLNIANGNNSNFTYFNAENNSNLTCIEVDNTAYSTANWTNIDAGTYFSEDCSILLTYVPDDNFEQALIDLGYDSGPLDDYVPTVNINTITFLQVHYKNIQDLTGIEDFTALTHLFCYANQLTSLDVSANVLLKDLITHGNQLSTIDLSSNVALQHLNIGYNQLTSLDVSNSPNLRFIYADNNLLNTLDVSNNTILDRLWLENNSLTSLDVRNGNNTAFSNIYFKTINNPNLACIEVDDVAYSTANWTNIDITSAFNTNCGTASIDEFNLDPSFSIYPNPVKDVLNIESKIKSEYQIYDCFGKNVIKDIISIGENNIDLDHLSNGVYFIRINSKTKKIIKSK